MDIALFSPSSLFAEDDDDIIEKEKTTETPQSYVERRHEFPKMELLIREFAFHELNANLLWPGTFAFAEWLVQNRSWIEGRRCIELGSGTGALAIFLQKSFNLDITTSDYNDQEIEENIAHNCTANNITPVLPHIKHSWGDTFPIAEPDWDLVIASDILLYVKQYTNLIKTLTFLLKSYKPKDHKAIPLMKNEQNDGTCVGLPWPAFLMSWRRRIGKEDESLFFTGCEDAGLEVNHMGSRVYCITPRETTVDASSIYKPGMKLICFFLGEPSWIANQHSSIMSASNRTPPRCVVIYLYDQNFRRKEKEQVQAQCPQWVTVFIRQTEHRNYL